MKSLPPLMLLCWGANGAWFARITKVGRPSTGTPAVTWKRPDERDRREATAATARDAVLRAISRYGKEPRTCRRCNRTWECKRTRAIRICPACQTKRAEPQESTDGQT